MNESTWCDDTEDCAQYNFDSHISNDETRVKAKIRALEERVKAAESTVDIYRQKHLQLQGSYRKLQGNLANLEYQAGIIFKDSRQHIDLPLWVYDAFPQIAIYIRSRLRPLELLLKSIVIEHRRDPSTTGQHTQ